LGKEIPHPLQQNSFFSPALRGLGIGLPIPDNGAMICLVKTTDPVRLTLLQALLADAQIPYQVFDQHISALEAGIGAFPRRLMVPDGYQYAARNILIDAEQDYDD
jgi:hypothetical protein